MTVAQLGEKWLEGAGRRLKGSTCSTYSVIFRAHVLPRFGSTPASRLTGEDIGDCLRQLRRKGLAQSTIAGISTVLRGILSLAANLGEIDSVPKWDMPPSGGARQAQVLSEEERGTLTEHLINNIYNNPEYLGLLLCLYTGMRLGEICALRWGDAPRNGGAIHIRRTVQRVYRGGRTQLVFDTPKSVSSNRVIPIPAFLADAFEALRGADGDFLLTGDDRCMDPRTMQNHFKALLKRCGLRNVNFHSMRHSFATECVEAGFDAKTLSNILGHANVAVTLNTYVHPSFGAMRRVMDGIGLTASQKAPFAKGGYAGSGMSRSLIHVQAKI